MTRDEHLMVIAMEECAEVAQRIAKAARFGMEQVQQDANDKPEENPERLTNRERIWREWCDLTAMMRMLGVPSASIARMGEKREKVERYLQRSARCGTLVNAGATPLAQGAPESAQDSSSFSSFKERA